MDKTRKNRNEIDEAYKWDLSKMYKLKRDWEKDFDKIDYLVDEIISYKGKIMDSSQNLLEVLKKEDELSRLDTNLYVYAHLKYYEDTTNNESLEMTGKIDKTISRIGEKTVFVGIEILKSSYSLVKKYIKELEDLKVFAFDLERLFRVKKHTLSGVEEKLMAGVSEVLPSPGKIYEVMKDTDLKYGSIIIDGEEVEITDSNYPKLLKQKNQELRKNVFTTLYKVYDNFKNTFATTMKYNVKTLTFISRFRKYDNPLQMSLYQDNIDPVVYNNLIDVINKNIGIMYKYIDLRKKELKLDELHMYDIYASMVDDSNMEYSFEDAKDLVMEALKPLGEDYIKDLNNAFSQRWIDVYDNIGKRSGAYSWGSYDSFPYLSLNFNNTLSEVSTLAHELGHSMHKYYTNLNQPHVYADFSIFTAEVASTVNEILLSNYLVNNTKDKNEKKVILNELLERFKGTLIRQTMFAEFEKIIFEKEMNDEVLTENVISDVYYNLNKKYYGGSIIHDEQIRYEWMKIPHFYRPFYVYQYATGISAACAIVTDILECKPGAVENYKKFLASGDSDYPINLLKIAGVDMSKPEPIEKAMKMFEDTINEYINLDK